jgi:hypothetical protein
MCGCGSYEAAYYASECCTGATNPAFSGVASFSAGVGGYESAASFDADAQLQYKTQLLWELFNQDSIMFMYYGGRTLELADITLSDVALASPAGTGVTFNISIQAATIADAKVQPSHSAQHQPTLTITLTNPTHPRVVRRDSVASRRQPHEDAHRYA